MPQRDLHPSDLVRLTHVLAAAREALQFARGRERSDLDSDPMLRRAVVHCIQEIGEAVSRVSEETRARAPAIPWTQIVGMRHRLVHAYFAIDANLVWEVLQLDLGPLVAELEKLLGQGGE